MRSMKTSSPRSARWIAASFSSSGTLSFSVPSWSVCENVLCHRDALGRAVGLLGQREGQHAVLVFGGGAFRVDVGRQREAAAHHAVAALAVHDLLVLLLFLLLLRL